MVTSVSCFAVMKPRGKNQSKDLAFVVLYNVTKLLDIPSCEI